MRRWDLARARSQQPARKYKPCGPVGERQPLTPTQVIDMRFTALPRAHGGGCDLIACSGCGHLQCSCPPKRSAAEAFGSDGAFRPEPHVTYEFPATRMPTPLERFHALERFRELGMLDTPGQREAVFRMLLDGDMSGFGVKP